MRPLVNLASNPFRNRRLFWLVILLLFAVPSWVGMLAIEKMTDTEKRIVEQAAKVRGLEVQLRQLEKPGNRSVTISPEQNRDLVAASELIARRAFSWSQLLNDIERNLPPNVRVLRVAVSQMQPDDRNGTVYDGSSAATLLMDVIGKSGQDVTNMINKFFESGRFKVYPIAKKAVEGLQDVEFSLRVEYFPPERATGAALANQIAEKKNK